MKQIHPLPASKVTLEVESLLRILDIHCFLPIYIKRGFIVAYLQTQKRQQGNSPSYDPTQ
ncbi:hypothetical protein JT359_02120 [Candidatus Poribacteria bacterium]|nr:hypothetical protein [Candidatus Poribacteria bacterium]